MSDTGTVSFDAVAAVYDGARPAYPRESADFLVDASATVVADVGAGTGIFTRMLQAPARTVFAIEPSPSMLRALRDSLPRVVAHAGTAERLPLADESLDAVTVAQAWHWVDPERASAETARVLRPGGRLGLMWNLRDERVPWMRALGDAMRADGDHFRGEASDPRVAEPFGEPERHLHEWTRVLPRETLLDDVRSRSSFPHLPEDEQESVIAAVEGVLDALSETAGETIALPYVTASFRYARP